MSTTDEDGGWTPVGSSSRRRRRRKKKMSMHGMRLEFTNKEEGGIGGKGLSQDQDLAPTEKVVAHYTDLVDSAISDVQESTYYRKTFQVLRDYLANVDGMYVWGLGSLEQPGAVHIRYQVAMAVLLHRMYALARSETYDPVYSQVDRIVHESYGFHVADASDGTMVATVPTLFFMPHCEAFLTANLLRRNIESHTLHNVIMLGNSLNTYKERGEMGIRRDDEHVAYLVAACVPRVKEIPLPEYSFPVSGAFNDLSLHVFSNE